MIVEPCFLISRESEKKSVAISTVNQDQFLGGLLGLAIGDAMGMPVRGWSADQIRERLGRIDGYHRLVLEDGAELQAGEFTDETEIVLCLVESMTTNGGELDLDTAGARLLFLARGESRRWLSDHERQALDRAEETLDFQVPINEDDPATGDVATRGVPVGLSHAIGEFQPEQLRVDAEAVTRFTHGSPAAIAGTTAVAYAVNLAARGEIPPDRWIEATAEFLGAGTASEALRLASERLSSGVEAAEVITELGTGEDAAAVVASAFVAAVANPDRIEDAVELAVNAGGATDSRGAIAGALLGAAHGSSGIPQRLIDELESRIYVSLAAPWFYRGALRRAGQVINLDVEK
jgi:ADP-ribosylglycohydrolase